MKAIVFIASLVITAARDAHEYTSLLETASEPRETKSRHRNRALRSPEADAIVAPLPRAHATASSSLQRLPPKNAIDGDMVTRWQSQSKVTKTEWISIDMGGTFLVSSVSLHWGYAYASAFDVETSSNAKSWTVKKSVKNGKPGTSTIDLPPNTKARYVRLKCKQAGTTYGFSLWEFVLNGNPNGQAPPLVPLPRKGAKASSQLTKYPTSFAVDGDFTNRWQSRRSDSQWIYIDLGAVYPVSRVLLYWGFSYGTEYNIETSNDAQNWSFKRSVTGGNGKKDTVDLPVGTRARYIRMRGKKRNSAEYGYTLREMVAEGTISGSPPGPTPSPKTPPPTQGPVDHGGLLPRAKVKASTQLDKLPSRFAIDGDMTTRWQSKATTGTGWIYLDMGRIYSVSQVVLNWGYSYAISYDIETSNDATKWTVKRSVTNSKGGTDTIDLPAGTKARYVRVKGKQAANKYGYSLYEFALHGDKGSTPVITPPPISTPPPTPTQTSGDQGVALPRVGVSASSELIKHRTSHAIDGQPKTRWQSRTHHEVEWIYVDMGAPYVVSRVLLDWGYSYGTEYDIETSDDATIWTFRRSVTNGKGGTEITYLPKDTMARYVRMSARKRNKDLGYTLWEFRLEGDTNVNGQTPAPTPPIPTPPPTPLPTVRGAAPPAPTPPPSPSPTPEPTPSPTPEPTPPATGGDMPPLTIVGSDGSPASAYPLGHCEGECNGNTDCLEGHLCLKRWENETVPGCSGPGETERDYCFDPAKATSHRFRLHWEAGYMWQLKPHERWFCMYYNATDFRINIQRCGSGNTTLFEFVHLSDFNVGEGDQIRMSGTNQCIQIKKNSNTTLVLQTCSIDKPQQRWVPGPDGDFHSPKFDIRPVRNQTTCMTQPHHPKAGEKIYLTDCAKAHDHTTGYWTKY